MCAKAEILKTLKIYLIGYSQVWFGRECSVCEEVVLHADTCNLGSGFLATDYMSFHQSPGTQGLNMRPKQGLSYCIRILRYL